MNTSSKKSEDTRAKKQSTLTKAFNRIVRRKTPTSEAPLIADGRLNTQVLSAAPQGKSKSASVEAADIWLEGDIDEDVCALNKDGTLKDAANIDFFNSPSDKTAISGPSARNAEKPGSREVSPSPSERPPRRRKQSEATEDVDQADSDEEDKGESEQDEEDDGEPEQDEEDDEDGEEESESETEDEGLRRYYELYRRQGKRKVRGQCS